MAKLSKEVLAKLQGYGMSDGVIKYTIKIETGVDDNDEITYLDKKYCPVFELQMPTNKEFKKLRKAVMAQQAEGTEIDELEMTEGVLKKAIIGWSNYYNVVTGEEIEFDAKLITELSQKLMIQIFLHIAETTGLI